MVITLWCITGPKLQYMLDSVFDTIACVIY